MNKTTKEVSQEWLAKKEQSRAAQENIYNAQLIEKYKQSNPSMMQFIDALAREKGTPGLVQLQSMIGLYLKMAAYGGGKGQ